MFNICCLSAQLNMVTISPNQLSQLWKHCKTDKNTACRSSHHIYWLDLFNNQAALVGIYLQGRDLCLFHAGECCSRWTLLGNSDLELREAPVSTNGINYSRSVRARPLSGVYKRKSSGIKGAVPVTLPGKLQSCCTRGKGSGGQRGPCQDILHMPSRLNPEFTLPFQLKNIRWFISSHAIS